MSPHSFVDLSTERGTLSRTIWNATSKNKTPHAFALNPANCLLGASGVLAELPDAGPPLEPREIVVPFES